MKKLLALLALVAMITVSSVAYAQTGTTTVNATVEGTRSITGCNVLLGDTGNLIVPSEGDRQKCNVTYANNITDGYSLLYGDADEDTSLNQFADPLGLLPPLFTPDFTIVDSIVQLVPSSWIDPMLYTPTFCGATDGGTTAGNVDNIAAPGLDCWSYTLAAKTDANAAYQKDFWQKTGPLAANRTRFSEGEHTVAPQSMGGLPVLNNDGSVAAAGEFNIDFWFEVQVDSTTRAGDYTNTTTVTIGDKSMFPTS